MRMAGPDIVLFVVGALLFAGATFAIVKTEGGATLGSGGSASGVYTVTYAEKDLFTQGADILDVGSGTASIPVTADNVGTVLVTFDCADPASQVSPFTYEVKATGPSGQTASAKSSCGNGKVTLRVPVAPKPPDTTTSGKSAADAEKNLPPPQNATAAKGTWKITVTGARNTPAPLPLGGTPAQPAGHVELKAVGWTPKLTPLGK